MQVATVTADEPSGVIRVLTYNVRFNNPGDGPDAWPHRQQTVAEVIENHADIAGLQEVLQSQLADLQKSLPNFAAYGVGRDDGATKGEYAPILYRRDRFESIDHGTWWLSPTPDQPGSKGWDAALPRIASWVKLKDRTTGKTLLFVNTHFDHQGAKAREESAKLLVGKLQTLAQGVPAIVVGDFNAVPDSPPLAAFGRLLRDTHGMVSKPVGPDGTFNGFKKIESGQRIDYILVDANIASRAHRTLDPRTSAGRFASDHLPVQAEVQLKPVKSRLAK